MSIKRILSIEVVKLRRPANFVLLGLMLLLYIGITAGTYYSFSLETGSIDVNEMLFKQILQAESSVIGFFLAIFVIMNIGKEYSDGTLRKNIIDGYTRDQFFTGKLILLLVIAFLVWLFGKVVMLIGGLIIGHFTETFNFLIGSILIGSFFQIFTTGIFAFFLTFLTRGITLAIVFYFVWGIIESLIVQLLKFFSKIETPERFLPLSSIKSALQSGQTVYISTILIACAYLFIMLFVPYYLLLKRDIK